MRNHRGRRASVSGVHGSSIGIAVKAVVEVMMKLFMLDVTGRRDFISNLNTGENMARSK